MPKKTVSNRTKKPATSWESPPLDTYRVMSLIPILRHHVVADIGCGPGHFTVPLAKHVYAGKVFAIDSQKKMLDATRAELERIHLTNVDLASLRGRKLPLEDESLDGAFVAFTVYKVSDRKELFHEIWRSLRRGGWLALLEWSKLETDDGPPVEDRVDEWEMQEISKELGLRREARHVLSDSQYMLLMRKSQVKAAKAEC